MQLGASIDANPIRISREGSRSIVLRLVGLLAMCNNIAFLKEDIL
jgi:hypothetical protein